MRKRPGTPLAALSPERGFEKYAAGLVLTGSLWSLSEWPPPSLGPHLMRACATSVLPTLPLPENVFILWMGFQFYIFMRVFPRRKKKDFIRLCVFSAQCGHYHASSWDLCLRMEVLGGWSLNPKGLTHWGHHKYLPHWIRHQKESFFFALILLLNFHIT